MVVSITYRARATAEADSVVDSTRVVTTLVKVLLSALVPALLLLALVKVPVDRRLLVPSSVLPQVSPPLRLLLLLLISVLVVTRFVPLRSTILVIRFHALSDALQPLELILPLLGRQGW